MAPNSPYVLPASRGAVMNQESEPLKYLPLIGVCIFLVFWGASQVVQAYAEQARHRAAARAGMDRAVHCAPRPASNPTSSSHIAASVPATCLFTCSSTRA